MARYWCERCKEESNTLSPPHLCKDVARRQERREAMRTAVVAILLAAGLPADRTFTAATDIVETLMNMGVRDF